MSTDCTEYVAVVRDAHGKLCWRLSLSMSSFVYGFYTNVVMLTVAVAMMLCSLKDCRVYLWRV